jgi:hypothetical protein
VRTIMYTKYPSTPHLPFSPGMQRDDTRISSLNSLEGREVIITEKMDGENCLEAGSLIQTNLGIKTIKEICDSIPNISVLSYNHLTDKNTFEKVIRTKISSKVDEWFEIETECGKTLLLTGQHLVWVENKKQYVKVQDLQGDEILKISS